MSKRKVRVVSFDDRTACVTYSDMRQHFRTILEQVLPRFGTVIILKNGRPVAVLRPPETIGYTLHEF